jgi:hypothetical protein
MWPGEGLSPVCGIGELPLKSHENLGLADWTVVNVVLGVEIGLRLIDQAVVDRIKGEFEAVGDTELVENIVQVILYGLFADEKFFADFLVAEALSDELHNFFLAVAEKWLFAARARLRRFREGLHDLCGHAVIEPDFAGVNAMNAFDEQVGGGLLENHATSAEAHGADNVAIVFGSRQDDDAGGQRIEIDFFEDGEAVFIGHAEIEQKDFRLEFGEKFNTLSAILGFADDSNVFVGIEKFAEAIAKDCVVVR